MREVARGDKPYMRKSTRSQSTFQAFGVNFRLDFADRCAGKSFLTNVYYRKRGSASYIVREVLSVREREIQRERERERERTEVTSPLSR